MQSLYVKWPIDHDTSDAHNKSVEHKKFLGSNKPNLTPHEAT